MHRLLLLLLALHCVLIQHGIAVAASCGPKKRGAVCPNGQCCSTAGVCGSTAAQCALANCQQGYGTCSYPVCGDGVCEAPWLASGETCGTCPLDCGPCQEFPDAYKCLENKYAAITVDDGPVFGATDTLLSILTKEGVTASFFLMGDNIATASSLLQSQVALKHSTLSHTTTHTSLTTLTPAKIYSEMAATEALFKKYTCRRPTLMRPPYGAIDDSVRTVLQRMGLRAVLWNVDTLDWQDAATNPNLVISDFKTNMAAESPVGVISLQHDIIPETVALMPKIIAAVRAAGYKFATVERCIWGPNYQRHPSWVQMHQSCPTSEANWPAPTLAEPCPVSDWSVWSMCDAGCGTGFQTRVRLTMPPGLEATSPACAGLEYIQLQPCTAAVAKCPSTCVYSPWSAWTACSKTCGGGTQVATRYPTTGSGTTCTSVIQTALCNTQSCLASPSMSPSVTVTGSTTKTATQTRTGSRTQSVSKSLTKTQTASKSPSKTQTASMSSTLALTMSSTTSVSPAVSYSPSPAVSVTPTPAVSESASGSNSVSSTMISTTTRSSSMSSTAFISSSPAVSVTTTPTVSGSNSGTSTVLSSVTPPPSDTVTASISYSASTSASCFPTRSASTSPTDVTTTTGTSSLLSSATAIPTTSVSSSYTASSPASQSLIVTASAGPTGTSASPTADASYSPLASETMTSTPIGTVTPTQAPSISNNATADTAFLNSVNQNDSTSGSGGSGTGEVLVIGVVVAVSAALAAIIAVAAMWYRRKSVTSKAPVVTLQFQDPSMSESVSMLGKPSFTALSVDPHVAQLAGVDSEPDAESESRLLSTAKDSESKTSDHELVVDAPLLLSAPVIPVVADKAIGTLAHRRKRSKKLRGDNSDSKVSNELGHSAPPSASAVSRATRVDSDTVTAGGAGHCDRVDDATAAVQLDAMPPQVFAKSMTTGIQAPLPKRHQSKIRKSRSSSVKRRHKSEDKELVRFANVAIPSRAGRIDPLVTVLQLLHGSMKYPELSARQALGLQLSSRQLSDFAEHSEQLESLNFKLGLDDFSGGQQPERYPVFDGTPHSGPQMRLSPFLPVTHRLVAPRSMLHERLSVPMGSHEFIRLQQHTAAASARSRPISPKASGILPSLQVVHHHAVRPDAVDVSQYAGIHSNNDAPRTGSFWYY